MKKVSVYVAVILSMVVLLIAPTPKRALAQETNSSHSNSGIGFYGTYEYLKDKPNNSEIEKIPSNGNQALSEKQFFPQTGEKQSSYLMNIGIGLILILIFLKYKTQLIGGNKK